MLIIAIRSVVERLSSPAAAKRLICACAWCLSFVALSAAARAAAPQAGPACPGCTADLNFDDLVDGTDLGILLAEWCPNGGCKTAADLDNDQTVDGTDLGILLGQWGPCASVPDCPLLIVADTDRNGSITNADLPGRAAWTTARGALYMVNVDDDKRSAAGTSDSVEFDKDSAAVIIDDKVNKGGDPSDITPVLIKPIGGFNAATDTVVIKTATLDQMKAIHIFGRSTPGQAALAGGPAATSTEVDITALVSATQNTTIGIEGLKFRLTPNGYAGLPAAMLFDGYVQLTVEQRRNGAALQTDTALLKVAPWIMFANELPLEKLFVCRFSVPDATGAPTANTQFRTDLASGLPANTLVEFTTDTQWAQDDIEFGYTQMPTSTQRVAAYSRHHESSDDPAFEGGSRLGDAQWRRDLVMGANAVVRNTGHYRMPRTVGAGSGDYGGNIELLPPTAAYPLGRVCYGSTISDLKRAWFKSQEVQPPFEIDTDWLMVGHVDEMVAFWKSAPLTVVLASPRLAYTELGYAGGAFPAAPVPLTSGSGASDSDVPDDAVFFSVGESRSGTATGGTFNTLQDPTANFLSGPTQWKFVRIYAGAGAGQTAHIAGIPDSSTLVVDQVWSGYDFADPQIVPTDIPAASPEGAVAFNAVASSTWMVPPDETSRYVVVEDTEWWTSAILPAAAGVFAGFTPATLTKADFDPAGAKGAKMRALNVEVQKKIDDARTRISAAAAPAVVTFVEVPVLYTGQLAGGAIVARTCVGFTPGAANMVFGNGKIFVPKQKGPQWRNAAGVLTKSFDDLITAALGGAGNVVFVEDWLHYHMLNGEVHCGSNSLRQPFPFPWWTRQPAGIPPLP